MRVHLSATTAWTATVAGRPAQTAQPGDWLLFDALDPGVATHVLFGLAAEVGPDGEG